MAQSRFIHHKVHDVVEAFFDDFVLKTDDDVRRWEREVTAALSPFGRKVDLLINLDGLHVKPSAAQAFGEVRAAVLARFARVSTRYGGDTWTQVSINTSAVRHGTHGNVHRTRDEALHELLRLREAP